MIIKCDQQIKICKPEHPLRSMPALDPARLDGKIFTEEDIHSIKCKMDMTMILYEAGPENECLPVADVLKLASPEPAE